jgi:hypothetical protein
MSTVSCGVSHPWQASRTLCNEILYMLSLCRHRAATATVWRCSSSDCRSRQWCREYLEPVRLTPVCWRSYMISCLVHLRMLAPNSRLAGWCTCWQSISSLHACFASLSTQLACWHIQRSSPGRLNSFCYAAGSWWTGINRSSGRAVATDLQLQPATAAAQAASSSSRHGRRCTSRVCGWSSSRC